MAKRRRKIPTVEIEDGRWYEISWIQQHETCCHCGLKHFVDHRVVGGKLQMRVHADGDQS